MVNGSARGTSPRALDRATAVMSRGYDVTVIAPASRDALRQAVAGTRDDLVIAVGGDGTVNAVVSALPAHAALGVLPIGTANDFACEIGVPRDPVIAAELLVAQREGPAAHLDLLEANGHPFCTVGGVGLVARTTSAVASLKEGTGVTRRAARLLGGMVYKLSATATLLWGPDLVQRIAIRFRDPSGAWCEWAGGAHALFVVNHRLCGGGLAIPTGSNGRDGIFELGIVTAGSRASLIANFSRLSARRPIGEHAFVVRQATEAIVSVATETPFAADGEILDAAREIVLRIRPGALRVLGVRPSRR